MRESFSRDGSYHPRGKPDFLRDEPPFPRPDTRNDRSARGYEVPRRVPIAVIQSGRAARRFDEIRAQAKAEQWTETEFMQRMDKEGFTDKGRADMSRRRFLQLGGAAVATVALPTTDYFKGFTALGRFLNDRLDGEYDYDAMVQDAKTFLKERYGVTLAIGAESGVKDSEHPVRGEHVDLERYRESIRGILQEITRYSEDMIRRLMSPHTLEIRIVQKLHKIDKDGSRVAIGGYAPFFPRVSGKTPIAIDAGSDISWQQRLLHHELNHKFVQLDEDRNVSEWTKLHHVITNTPYGTNGGRSYKGPHDTTRPLERYFLSHHAALNPMEDMATCAEYMLTPKLHIEFIERWRDERDPKVKTILAKKYTQTRYNYQKWSGGKMSEQYWSKIIEEGYAQRKREQSIRVDKLQGRVGQ